MLSLAEKWLHDMALSEHGLYAPKRFTIGSGLTNTKVRICGTMQYVQKKHLGSNFAYFRG